MTNKTNGQEERPSAVKLPKKSTSSSDTVAHVVLRVKSEEGLTLSAHRRLIEKHGRAMFAKIGKGLSTSFFEQLNSQIKQGIPTYLFLAVYDGWNAPFDISQSELLGIHTEISSDDKIFIPDYVRPLIANVHTWFEIGSIRRVAQSELKRIRLLTTRREISGSLRGATSMFRVVIEGNAALKLTADSQIKPSATVDKNSQDFDEEIWDSDDDLSNLVWLPQNET